MALMLMNLVPAVPGMSYITLASAYVSDVLKGDAAVLGYLMAVNGVGAVIGTFSVARYTNVQSRGTWILRLLIVFATLLVGFCITSTLWIAFVLVFLLGLTYGFVVALNDTLIQLLVDEAFRWGVMSVYAMIPGLSPLGGLLAGWIASEIGMLWGISIMGLLILGYIPYLWLRTID